MCVLKFENKNENSLKFPRAYFFDILFQSNGASFGFFLTYYYYS